MKTEMVKLDSILLGGFSFYGDPLSTKGGWDSENEIGKTWERFTCYLAANPKRSFSCGKPSMYEVHIYGEETAAKGYFEVFVGEEINTPKLPVALSSKFISESHYLKITLSGYEITGDWWKTLDSEILPSHGVKRSDSYIIQAYDERFKGMDKIADSEMVVFIPVETA